MYSHIRKQWTITHVIIGPPNVGKTHLFWYFTEGPLYMNINRKSSHSDRDSTDIYDSKRISTRQSPFANTNSNSNANSTVISTMSHQNSQNWSRILERHTSQATIGCDYGIRHMKIDDISLTVFVWDTAGQEKYNSITNQYFKKAHIIWIVIDLHDIEKSLYSIEKYWIKTIDEFQTQHSSHCAQKILLGNKCDLVNGFDISDENQERIHQLCSQYKMPYFTISAKTGTNIASVFVNVTTALFRNVIKRYGVKNDKNNNNNNTKNGQYESYRHSNNNYYNYNNYDQAPDDSETISIQDESTVQTPADAKLSSGGCCW